MATEMAPPPNDNAVPFPGGLRVLVVDPDSTSLESTCEVLQSLGYTAVTAATGAAALEVLLDRPIKVDLILTEARLPDIDAFELLDLMQRLSNLPVIIVSSVTDEDEMLRFLTEGAELYIVKPVAPDDLKNLWQFTLLRGLNVEDDDEVVDPYLENGSGAEEDSDYLSEWELESLSEAGENVDEDEDMEEEEKP
ncbi:hypothetical protein Tsubulata_042915 [Turnera subulata]|uniref:Response regulatory domain-containing protein n=1 Tax=Turnera subulata TaxID=218843 RepID=A0A9Q0F811_9ROSI|nr:hypothetical protein Tsubulata_042915 [Turnera subulata]